MTSLYLSRCRLRPNPSNKALSGLIDDSDTGRLMNAHHRLVWTLFADREDRKRDFLWRYDGKRRFYTLSARPPRDSDFFDPPETKAFSPGLRPGDRLSFVLRANATRERSHVRDNRRVDVVMDMLRDILGEERASRRMKFAQEAANGWMTRQGALKGFVPEQILVENYSTLSLSRRGNRPAQFGLLDIRGRIELTDPENFIHHLAAGFGRAKAWGCGLMMIRRS